MADNTYVIPPIGTSGVFTFKAPFDNVDKIAPNEELTVQSIRSLQELISSDEDPLGTIYMPQGLTSAEFNEDLKAKMYVAVFTRTNGDYYYVPVNRIATYPNITGYKYCRLYLAANLGSLPLDYDTSKLLEVVNDAIYATTGITTEAITQRASAVTYLTPDEHNSFQATLKGKMKVDKPLSVQLNEANVLINNLQKSIQTLEAEIANLVKAKQ